MFLPFSFYGRPLQFHFFKRAYWRFGFTTISSYSQLFTTLFSEGFILSSVMCYRFCSPYGGYEMGSIKTMSLFNWGGVVFQFTDAW